MYYLSTKYKEERGRNPGDGKNRIKKTESTTITHIYKYTYQPLNYLTSSSPGLVNIEHCWLPLSHTPSQVSSL